MSEDLRLIFVLPDKKESVCIAKTGESVLAVAHRNGIDLEGACEGSLACSTCHVYLEDPWFDKLEEISDEENDMLDLAFELKTNSRLGCQIIMKPELDGLRVVLPHATRNL